MLVLNTYMYNVTIHVHLVLTCTSGLTLVLYFSTHLQLPLLTGLFHIQHVFSLILNKKSKKIKNQNQIKNKKQKAGMPFAQPDVLSLLTARRSVSTHSQTFCLYSQPDVLSRLAVSRDRTSGCE